MTSQPTPSRKAARAELAARRRAEAEAARRRERLVRAGVVGLVLAAVVVAGVVLAVRDRNASEEAARQPVPAGATGVGGGIAVGPADAPVLDLWEDFQCPACAQLERTTGPTIEQLVDDGELRVVYHPLSFLDDNLGNDASRRSAAAAGCAADAGVFREYHDAVFAAQPAEEGVGYTDEQLLEAGRTAGLDGAAYDTFATCVDEGRYDGWVRQVADSQDEADVRGTPTLRLDGRTLEGPELTPEGLTAAVRAAAAS
ncbi:DsbA family protein [Vallicoccus soli]|uniref:Thioredoxin-like fold domain-containing protein n=1 Tax=Vallicoccus soli TaxID=2339232 RepID=A0A3A3YSQ5_9ACTN|nr:thioredoxin domain-containing protein [Vallicoccus soli]RJK93720.1 hypothetical protein D5H78_15360 [Vallicoccus soli]